MSRESDGSLCRSSSGQNKPGKAGQNNEQEKAMIQVESMLNVADNSGAKTVQCIKVLGGTRRRYASVGDVIVVAVKTALPNSTIKKDPSRRRWWCEPTRSTDGLMEPTFVLYDNACVIIDANKNPKGKRIFGPVARELREKDYMKIVSLAPEVL